MGVSTLGKLYGALSGKAAGSASLGVPGGRGASPFRSTVKGGYSNAGAPVHAGVYGGGRNGIDYFYEVANIFATAASNADWHLRDDDRNRHVLELPDGEVPDNLRQLAEPLATLFTLPNPWMTWRELIELYVIDLLAVGDAFWLKQGAMPDGSDPLALYRVAPQFTEVIPGKDGDRDLLIKKYKFGQGDKALIVDAQFVVHTRLPNPHSDNSMLGLGVVQAAPQVFDVELGLLEAQRSFFDNGTVLGGTLESDKTIPESTRKKNLREFRSLTRGSRNWFNVVHLERGLRYRPIQANAQEADFHNLSQHSRERIFGMLRTPLILSGVGTVEASGMKMDEARRFWSEEVGGPFLSRLSDSLTYGLLGGTDFSFRFDFGYKMPEADKVALALDYADLPGIQVREVRAKAGLAPLPDDLVDPETDEPINDLVLNLPGPSTEGPVGSPDNLDGQDVGGRPADPANIPAISGRQASRPDEGPNTTRARRQRVGAASMRPVRRQQKAQLFTPEELANGAWKQILDGYKR